MNESDRNLAQKALDQARKNAEAIKGTKPALSKAIIDMVDSAVVKDDGSVEYDKKATERAKQGSEGRQMNIAPVFHGIAWASCLWVAIVIGMFMLSASWRMHVAVTLAFWLGYDSGSVHAAEPAPDCPGRHVLAAVDATTPYDEIDRAEIIAAFGRMAGSMHIGDRLHIVTVTESAEKSALLFDGCVPGTEELSWVDAAYNMLLVPPGQAKAEFFIEAGNAVEPVLYQRHETPATALAGTLTSYAPVDDLWLFTDLLESASVDVDALLSGDEEIDDILLPRMPGVTAHIAGIGRFHDTARTPLDPEQIERLLAAWRAWFAGAGVIMEVVR